MVKRISNGTGNGARPRMRDVADLAGVSQATVSYVVNAKKNARISLPTRERVLEAAARLQYKPNAIARAMALGRSKTIGLYQPHVGESPLSGMWTMLVTRGISEELHAHEYHLLLFGYRDSDEQPPGAFLDGRVDGLIILAPHVGDELPTMLRHLAFPTAIISGHVPPSERTITIDVDNIAGAVMATEHLILLGHRRIAHLKGPVDVPSAVDRVEGYRRALANHEIPFRHELILQAGFDEDSGYRAAKTALEVSPAPTAMFACNDIAAVGALRACSELGYGVPDDVAIVGYDDAPVCELTQPAITTVRQPAREMGRAAAQMLLRMREDATPVDNHREFMPDLIVRESCGGRGVFEREVMPERLPENVETQHALAEV